MSTPARAKKTAKPKTIFTLADFKFLFPQITNPNHAHRLRMSALDKVAVWVTGHVGTMEFFLLIFIWTAGWLAWNTLAPAAFKFDPYPAFVLWLFISNMIQICLMPLIMVGQNLQGRHAEQRAESDYAVNVRSEEQINTILARLEAQDKILAEIRRRLPKK